jgi:hypothetical protein
MKRATHNKMKTKALYLAYRFIVVAAITAPTANIRILRITSVNSEPLLRNSDIQITEHTNIIPSKKERNNVILLE